MMLGKVIFFFLPVFNSCGLSLRRNTIMADPGRRPLGILLSLSAGIRLCGKVGSVCSLRKMLARTLLLRFMSPPEVFLTSAVTFLYLNLL